MTPGRNTVIPPSREAWDVICAHLSGEISEGRLREVLKAMLGWTGTEARAAWFDAVNRGVEIAMRWPSPVHGMEANTPGQPGSPGTSGGP